MTSVSENGTIEFRFYRPGASEVKIVGSFNAWDRRGLSMRALGNGWWATQAEFEPGEYQFRYVADGDWYTDYAAHGVENTKHGWNSILIVPDRTLQLYPALVRDVDTESTVEITEQRTEAVAA